MKFKIVFLLYTLLTLNAQKKSPNIIYILADDMGYGDISGLNENGKIKTPNLDKLISQGMRFTDAHTSSSVCTPTRYGIITGRYNWRSKLKRGVVSGTNRALIPNDRSTVASILKENGYTTAMIGKWHLGWDWATKKGVPVDKQRLSFDDIDFNGMVTNSPKNLGFDYYYGHCASLDMAPYVYVESDKVVEAPNQIVSAAKGYGKYREGPKAEHFIIEDVTPNFFRRGISYIGEYAKEEKPFFLYLPLPSPHTPILPTKEFQGKSSLNPYGDFVMMIDSFMGELIEAVEKTGEADSTIIIFTSDNGCSRTANFKELSEKGHAPNYIYRGSKSDIFEGGHRVPFIVKWPDVIESNSVSNQTICTTDLMATCADIVKYQLKDIEGEDSFSLLPIFESKVKKPIREATVHHSIAGEFAIRKGDYKLITCPGSGGWSSPNTRDDGAELLNSLPKVQLYNLKEDPKESKNLESVYPKKVFELATLLHKYINDGRSTKGTPQSNDAYKGKWSQINTIETLVKKTTRKPK